MVKFRKKPVEIEATLLLEVQQDELPETMFRTSVFDESLDNDLLPTKFVPVEDSDDDNW